MGFEDKIVVITDAGSGVGRSLAIGFSRDEPAVIGLGLSDSARVGEVDEPT